MSISQRQQHYDSQTNATVGRSQECLKEYLHNLESYDGELRRLSEHRESLTAEVNALRIDRQTKYKMIGACLTVMKRMEKVRVRREIIRAFQIWRQNAKIEKVVETAFNKMLELNYKHAAAQYNAAAFLLKRSLIRKMKRIGLDAIL